MRLSVLAGILEKDISQTLSYQTPFLCSLLAICPINLVPETRIFTKPCRVITYRSRIRDIIEANFTKKKLVDIHNRQWGSAALLAAG